MIVLPSLLRPKRGHYSCAEFAVILTLCMWLGKWYVYSEYGGGLVVWWLWWYFCDDGGGGYCGVVVVVLLWCFCDGGSGGYCCGGDGTCVIFLWLWWWLLWCGGGVIWGDGSCAVGSCSVSVRGGRDAELWYLCPRCRRFPLAPRPVAPVLLRIRTGAAALPGFRVCRRRSGVIYARLNMVFRLFKTFSQRKHKKHRLCLIFEIITRQPRRNRKTQH